MSDRRSSRRPSRRQRAADWTRAPRTLRLLALLSVIVNVGIVVTGGAVRLTDSGLGCPTWPRCTAPRSSPTARLGINGAIEFTNRIADVRRRRRRCSPPSWSRGGSGGTSRLAALAFAGIPAQARARRHRRAHRPEPVARRAALPALRGDHRRHLPAVVAGRRAHRRSAAAQPVAAARRRAHGASPRSCSSPAPSSPAPARTPAT